MYNGAARLKLQVVDWQQVPPVNGREKGRWTEKVHTVFTKKQELDVMSVKLIQTYISEVKRDFQVLYKMFGKLWVHL